MTNELVLNSETCDNIIKMLNSSDKENWTVVEQLLAHIDIETNLPYILLLYKESRSEVRKAIFSTNIISNIRLVCKSFSENANQQITYQDIYTEIKSKNVSEESLNFFLEKFSTSLKFAMTNWGYSFMEDFELKLIPKNEQSR